LLINSKIEAGNILKKLVTAFCAMYDKMGGWSAKRGFPMKLLAVALLMAGAALAADVDGKWTGSMSTPNGDVPVAFTFKADGATLNGSTMGPDGAEIMIKDGKVDGSNISFTVTFDFQGMPFTLNYKGAVAKDEIKFMIDIFGMPFELTVKRAG
jgi:hypothetical protein